METTNKLTYLSTKFFTENKEKYRITVTISLDDDCHNNMCDWSVTADIRQKNKYGTYGEYMGGCCHNEVAKHFPELAKFISLHLCNHYGAPMYPVENGIYHVRRSGISVAMSYLRISEKDFDEKLEEWKSGEINFLNTPFYIPGEKPNAWIRIKGNIIETSKQIKIGVAEARKLWRAVSAMHRGAEFRHGLVEDVTGHQWSLNRYENDLLTAGCHRIAYDEMERIAKQLGWV